MQSAGRYRLLQHNDEKKFQVQLDFAFVSLARINTGFTSSLFDKATYELYESYEFRMSRMSFQKVV